MPESHLRRSMLILLLIIFNCLTGFAELPPYVYKQKQQQAPESLVIKVRSVEAVETEEASRKKIVITVEAEVQQVERTRSGLRPGDKIYISYLHSRYKEPVIGPGEVPVLKKGQVCPAFLAKAEKGNGYIPVAGGYSFKLVK